jgi:hypothetical protein
MTLTWSATRIVFIGIFALAAAVLAYGYWFGLTHGALYVNVLDVSDSKRPQDVRTVELTFSDAAGRTLAEATSVPPTGTIFLVMPSIYACHDLEERAPYSTEALTQWNRCFERQSRWLPTWIRSAKTADVRTGDCTINRLPIAVLERPDTWWLWWVPLRHIGGKPYTSFTIRIEIDRVRCRS